MPELRKPKYTIVRHSGYVSGGDSQFARGLESHGIATVAELRLVEGAGGLVFDDYAEAEDYADAEMFPPGYAGLVPQAPGTFSEFSLASLPLYLPKSRQLRVVVSDPEGTVLDSWMVRVAVAGSEPHQARKAISEVHGIVT